MVNPELLQRAMKEHEQKLFLKDKEARYYPEKMEDLGLKSTERFLRYHPDPSRLMRLGISYAHRDLEAVAEAIANNKPWAVVSGLNPSGPLHLGHKAIFDELLWFQSQGAELFIPITNDESYVVDKTKSIAEARRIAYESVIPSIIAMGFDPKRTHLFVDSDYTDIYNVAMDVSKHITLNKALKVFGFNESEDNPGSLFYRSAVQIAQILLPQYPEFGGPKPTLVPVGIDQHPYILLARDVAEKKGFIPPAELTLKFLWGIDGKGKMSASREGSAIFLTDDPQLAVRRIRSSYTGGSAIAAYQRDHGGVAEICPVFAIQQYHFDAEGTNLYQRCTTGQLLCGECKGYAAENVRKYLEDFQSRLPEAKKRTSEFLLTTQIRSVLEK